MYVYMYMYIVSTYPLTLEARRVGIHCCQCWKIPTSDVEATPCRLHAQYQNWKSDNVTTLPRTIGYLNPATHIPETYLMNCDIDHDEIKIWGMDRFCSYIFQNLGHEHLSVLVDNVMCAYVWERVSCGCDTRKQGTAIRRVEIGWGREWAGRLATH